MKSFGSMFGVLVVGSFLFVSCLDSDVSTYDFEGQWKQDTTAIGLFIRTQSIPALKDASGVYINITEAGSGFPPKRTSEVRFDYKLSIVGNPTIIEENDGFIADVIDLVPGMQIGLQHMLQGGKAEIFIPSGYAYANNVSENIPANSNLKFEIELTRIEKPTGEATQLDADTVALDTYLEAEEIANVIKDSTGLRYVITTEGGNGPTATLYDRVKINYTGKMVVNETTFFTGSSQPTDVFDSRVINYLHGIQAGLRKMKAGAKATLYVPSVLGFGNQPVTGANGISVPPNSNLIYEIELLEIID
jgi:FKBP-type peptidyl-prolyl cis-trans isomerase FkpA